MPHVLYQGCIVFNGNQLVFHLGRQIYLSVVSATQDFRGTLRGVVKRWYEGAQHHQGLSANTKVSRLYVFNLLCRFLNFKDI